MDVVCMYVWELHIEQQQGLEVAAADTAAAGAAYPSSLLPLHVYIRIYIHTAGHTDKTHRHI